MSKNSFSKEDITFMRAALKEAHKAFEEKEVPVGCVLVQNNKIIAYGRNQVEKLQDATAHAEILCLSAAPAIVGDWRLEECTLYSTLEPCPMCAGAILQSRIKRLVWGAFDLRLGANGSWIDLFAKKHPFHEVIIETGLLREESAYLMQSFFHKRREDGRKTCSIDG